MCKPFNRLLVILLSAAICVSAAGIEKAHGATRIWEGNEPSGIVWHPRLNKYIWVDDGGWVRFTDTDGQMAKAVYLGGDIEGITIADVDSDYYYVGIENPDSIKEVHIWTDTVTRTFNLTPWMNGTENQGLEALTFVTDSEHPEGGRFYAGHQEEGSIYKFSLPIKTSSSSTVVQYEGKITIGGRSDLSGLCYHAPSHIVYALFDSSDEIVLLDPEGSILDEWSAPGDAQEGLAIRDCTLTIAEDSGEIWVYSWLLEACDCPVFGDSNGDCDVDLEDFAVFQQAFTGDLRGN